MREMSPIKKISEAEMLARLRVGEVLLPPLVVRSFEALSGPGADARLELALPGEQEGFRFVLESKGRATPQAVQLAMMRAKAEIRDGEWPMIQVPFLSPQRLDDLEREGVSGVDLCGNGLVVVPGRMFVSRSGEPNRYRDSRPLNNPYRGRSAMVARMLLQRPHWESLSTLFTAVVTAGCELSLPQTSKAVHAMAEDLVLSKIGGAITLREPLRLLDELKKAWRRPPIRARQAVRLPANSGWARSLSAVPRMKWAVTGESSAPRYAVFSQGGPRRIAVSDLGLALSAIGGVLEPVPSFAELELVESDEAGFFFGNEIDEEGIRWASRLQTWLELDSGDARQQDAAKDLRQALLQTSSPGVPR